MASGGGATTLVLNVSKAPFDATPPVTRAAVRSGDPSPAGGGFGSFANPLMLSSKDVASSARPTASSSTRATGPATIALSGDATPVGGTFSNFGIQASGTRGTGLLLGRDPTTARPRSHLRAHGHRHHAGRAGWRSCPDGGSFISFASGIAVSPSGTQLAFIAADQRPGDPRAYVARAAWSPDRSSSW
jgi:hypothetical protein